MLLSIQTKGKRPVLFTTIFIAVLVIHLLTLYCIWRHPFKASTLRENIKYLESVAPPNELAQSEDQPTQRSIPPHPAEMPLFDEQVKEAPKQKKILPANKNNDESIKSKSDKLMATSHTPPDFNASYLNNPPPIYPRQSRRRGENGKVVIAAEIEINGKVSQIKINASSGHPRLDQAALETVLNWRFVPGKKAGMSQKMWVNIPINFVLE